MNKYYIGLDYYKKQTSSFVGSLSWESDKMEYPYDSLEKIEEDIFIQYREEYKAMILDDEPEGQDMPVFSIEEEIDGVIKPIIYCFPPCSMMIYLGVDRIKFHQRLLDFCMHEHTKMMRFSNLFKKHHKL